MTPRSRVHSLPGSAFPDSPDAAQALLRSLLLAMDPVVIRLDDAFKVRFISRITPEYRLDQVLGVDAVAFIDPSTHAEARACWERALRGEPGYFRTEMVAAGGVVRSYETWVAPYDGPEGRGVTMVSVEITPYREQERALLRSEASLEMALEATGLGLWSWDLASNTVRWNDRMEAICGQRAPLALGDFMEQLVHPDDRAWLRAATENNLQQPRFSTPPYRILRKDGRIRHVRTLGTVLRDAQGQMTGVMGGTLDVTAEHQREEVARQRQKLESIGQLTAGIAHNFNNLLATIIPTLELLAPTAPPRLRLLADDALRSAVRAAEILQQLGHYARQEPSTPGSVTAVAEPVGRAVRLCHRLFEPTVEISQTLDPSPLHVGVGDAELEQAVVNLLLNARDALAATAQPRILVQATREEPPPELGWQPRDRTLGAVCIRVVDNGPGMTEEVRRRVFEPFFTTKEAGQGTGLGLATVDGMLRRVGGQVRCLSQPGKGARFELWFQAEPPPPALGPSAQPPLVHGQGEQVLVVDDEPGILHTTSLLLEEAGYRPLTAGSCQEALAQVQAQPGICAVLLDRWLPDGSGTELIEPFRAKLPGVVLLLHSGNHVPPEERARVDGVLEKPVSPTRLLQSLAHALATSDLEP